MNEKELREQVAVKFVDSAEMLEALLATHPALRKRLLEEWGVQGYPSAKLAGSLVAIPEFLKWQRSVSPAEFGVTLCILCNNISVRDAVAHQQRAQEGRKP